MSQELRTVPPGSRVRVVGLPLEVQLVRVTPGRALVKLTSGIVEVKIGDRSFEAARSSFADWSPRTRVEVLG